MRDLFRSFFSILFLLSLTAHSSALTLAEALEQAEQHPVLKIHDLNIQGRQDETIDASSRGPANVAISSENFGGDSGFSGIETTLEVEIPLKNARRISARKKLASIKVNLSKLEKETARWLIMSQTTRAFHKALAISGLADKARENIENSEKLLNASKIMVDSGAVAEQEIYQAELVLQQARMDLQSLQGLLDDAKADLVTAMGLEDLTDMEIIGSITAELELSQIDELERIIFNSHPDILNRQIEATNAQARLDLIKAESSPVWSVTAGVRNIGENGTNDFLVGFSAELPRARDSRGERIALQKDLERIALEKKNSQRELHLQLQGSWKKFKRLQEQTKKLRDEILPGAYHLFELSLTGYQLGKTDQIVVLQAQKEFIVQKESYLQRLEELYDAADSIESLAGYSGSYSSNNAKTNQQD